jgi:hypothetical protein
MYGVNTRGLPGTLAPIYQGLHLERTEPPATSRIRATQLSSASARACGAMSSRSRTYSEGALSGIEAPQPNVSSRKADCQFRVTTSWAQLRN